MYIDNIIYVHACGLGLDLTIKLGKNLITNCMYL